MDCVDNCKTLRVAHLHHADITIPGITRTKKGKEWTYARPDGRTVHDVQTLARIRDLGLPPAWREVWICPDPRGHIQATGIDAAGRRQYRYHADWQKARSHKKFDHLVSFGEGLPKIRTRTDEHLRLPGLPREKVLALLVRLLDSTLLRIGNEEYAREHHSYGLTTLRPGQVSIHGTHVHMRFRGKRGKWHTIDLDDPRAACIIRQCEELPGHELFQYRTDDADHRVLHSHDVNEYIHASAPDCSAKDFRTWGGTIHAAWLLYAAGIPSSARASARTLVDVIREVSALLGNTPAVCRSYYIDPRVCEAYREGSLFKDLERYAAASPPHNLRKREYAVWRFLKG